MDLKEAATKFVAKTISNVAVLDRVPINAEIELKTFKEGTKEEYESYIATIEGNEFYIAMSVMGQIQEFIADMPGLKAVRVKKNGEGLNTRYVVIPLTGD